MPTTRPVPSTPDGYEARATTRVPAKKKLLPVKEPWFADKPTIGLPRSKKKLAGVVGSKKYFLGEMTPDEAPTKQVAKSPGAPDYAEGDGFDAFVQKVWQADALALVELERHGVRSTIIRDMGKSMNMPLTRLLEILRVPKATAARKLLGNLRLDGQAGQAAIALIRLLGLAQDVVDDSTAAQAKSFDTTKWLAQWLERPQPALGGRKPSELMDTPAGATLVARLLGASRSGAYQ